MKSLALLLCVVVYVEGDSESVNEANDFVDEVLLQRMPSLMKETPGLYPSAPIRPFRFTVDRTAITNRDLKVNVTGGNLKNFDTSVRRFGNCDPKVVAGNTTVTCRFSLDGIAAEMALVVWNRGDDLIGAVKNVDVQGLVYNSTGSFEVTAARHQPGFLRYFVLKVVIMDVTVEGNLDLNESRMSIFKSYLAGFLREELYDKLFLDYQKLLSNAVSQMDFSLV